MSRENDLRLTNLDWFITRVCDQAQHCRFCYAPWNAFQPDADLIQALKVCDRIAELGITWVTLCGGEPTLYPHLVEVIRKLKERRVNIILYSSLTNDFDFRLISSCVHTFSIPIDGVTPSVIGEMRGMHQFQGVARFLNWIADLESRPLVKVGTVLTKKNIGDLQRILSFIEASKIVDVWRIYQFSPYGIGKRNETQFLIGDDEFRRAVAVVKANVSADLNIAERSRDDTNGYCRIMDSRGMFYRYEERYIPLGISIFASLEDITAHFDNEKNEAQKAWHSTSKCDGAKM